MTAKKNPKFYIDKKEMFQEIVKSKENGKCSEELGLMFMKLAEKYSHHPMFRDYERRYGKAFKDDLIATGLHACAKAWNKFDPEKSDNPFSFFTTCLYRAFIGYLAKEYDFTNTKNALKVDQGLRGDYGYEEMIKEKEDAEKVEDEEEYAHQIMDELDTDEEEEEDKPTEEEPYKFGVEDKKEVKKEPVAKKTSNNHLDGMTLWGEDEEEEEIKPDFNEKISAMFGVN